MPVQVVMPTFGMTEGEATIVRWLKAVGDTVRADEPLLEAETDKALLEVPAPADGVLLHIEAAAGQMVAYKSILGWIGQLGEEPGDGMQGAPEAEAQKDLGDRAALLSEAEEDEGWVRASPLARRKARDSGLDLRQVKGTGPLGRVMEADVLNALAVRSAVTEASHSMTEAEPDLSQPDIAARIQTAESESDTRSEAPGRQFEVPALTRARRITAERMTESFRTAPHFYLQVEVRAARLVALREELLPELEQLTGVRLSYTDLLLRTLALLLPNHPLLNASWHEGEVRTYPEVHLALAVATPQGLLVPVVHRAEQLALPNLMRERDFLTRKAGAGALTPADLTGGTCTLTNLGMYGIDGFIPILNPPQSAILAAGTIAERPVGAAGQVVLQPTLNLTLAVDHRVADGAQAAEFVRDLKALLEAPARMLL
jgi:pyruvate dehydrogenase E2 component (dihydrolipoamide acetyltransferase)